jgi:hypothetical protein
MRAAVVGLAVAAGGCNAIFGLDPTSQRDGDGGVIDAATTGDGGAAWNTPVPLTVAADPLLAEDDPAMGPGGLELYWSIDIGDGQKDIVRSVRPDVDEQFTVFQPVAELNSAFSDATVRIVSDATTLYMASDRAGAGTFDIFTASRVGPSWSKLQQLGEPYSSAGNDIALSPCTGASRFILASDRLGNLDLLEISKDGIQFTANSDNAETSPFVTEDCLTLYFAMDTGSGTGQDIFVTTRESTGLPWKAPRRVDELSGESDEQDPWVSGDGSVMLFASDRSGSWDIWQASVGR